MAWAIDSTLRNTLADAVDDAVNTGSGTAVIEIRTGSPPGIGNAATGTLLASISLQNPAFGNAASGIITLNGTPLSATASATGTAGYCRLKDRNGTARGEGTVTATGGGGDLTLASTSIVSGATVRITSGTITVPAGG